MTMNYPEIEQKMKAYRIGMTQLPEEYIAYHKDLAETALSELKKQGVIVHAVSMVSDGWGIDSMKVLQAIVEENNTLSKIIWHDANSEGAWFVSSPCGGWVLWRLVR